MATENPVYNVLATLGNQAPLAAGARVDTLANGQIGVFNFHTGLSIDGTVSADNRDIFLAVGINRTSGGTATAEDISKSAGQLIQAPRAKSFTIKGYTPAIQKVVSVNLSKAKCKTNYALKLIFDSIQLMGINGYNQIAKTFEFEQECCTSDTDDSVAPIIVLAALRDNINADTDKAVIASLSVNRSGATLNDPTTDGTATFAIGTESFAVPLLAADTPTTGAAKVAAFVNAITTSAYYLTATAGVIKVYTKAGSAVNTPAITISNAGGTGATLGTAITEDLAVTDAVAFQAANPLVNPELIITGVAEVRPAFSDIAIKYYKANRSFQVIAMDGFLCDGRVDLVTDSQTGEGSGLDIKKLENFAKGWGKPGPYRTNAVTGLPNTVEAFVNSASNYNLISLTYDQKSVGGWQEFENNLETVIVVPCADSTTLVGLVGILSAIFTQFGTMVNDVSAMGCSNTNITTINDVTKDGIESLA